MKGSGFILLLLSLNVVSNVVVKAATLPPTCPADIRSDCDTNSGEWEGEFFPGIPEIKYEGPSSKNPLSFKWYNAEEEILGKKMKDWMRFSVAFWHTFRGTGADPFGSPTKTWPWEDGTNSLAMAKKRMRANFEFIEKLGVDRWCFHDRDIAPDGETIEESNANLDEVVALAKELQGTKIRPLWGTAQLFYHPRFMHGAATSPELGVFVYSAAQVKKAMEVTHYLGGENYVFWGGREGYQSLLNTDMERELNHMARFFEAAVAYKKKIGFNGTLLIEPKPQEPTKHQYDWDAATAANFLRRYGLIEMSPPRKSKSGASHVDDEVEKSASKTNATIKEFFNNNKVKDDSLGSYINKVKEKYAPLLQDIFRRMKSGLSVNPHEDLATIYEWKAIIGYHRLHNDVCYTDAFIAHVLRDGVKIAKNEALYYPILAEKFVKDGELGDAIECYKLAGDGCHNERLHELEQLLKKTEKQRKEAIDYIMQEKPKEEAKKKCGKRHKKSKSCSTKVELVERTAEPKVELVERTAEVESPKLRGTIEPRAKRLRFTYEFCGVGGVTIMDGSMEHCGKRVGVSLIKATHVQIHKVEELNLLCSEHRNLLNIFHVASEEPSNVQPFLVTEQVCSIEKYFEKEYVGLGGPDPITNQIWWDYIQQKFQLIFGGVIQGLIHLYRSGKACGDLSFSTFVTTQSGEGRILPSLDAAMNPKQMVKDDIKQLIQVMKSVIMLAHVKGGQKNENFVVKLPMELVHFFHFFTTQEMKMIPASFWVDHPYFWTTVERVAFAYRLNRVVKRENLKRAIEKAIIEFTAGYLEWWQILEGPYRELYRKSQPDPEGPSEELPSSSEELQSQQPLPTGCIKLRSYEMSADIIRFYMAVYTHINDSEYQIDKKVVLSDAEIEADLSNFYPKFYTDMFETICRYVWQCGKNFKGTILREISNFRFSDSEHKNGLNTEEWLG